jgi:hypothetical protein
MNEKNKDLEGVAISICIVAKLQSKIEQLENVLLELSNLPNKESAIIPYEIELALKKYKIID